VVGEHVKVYNGEIDAVVEVEGTRIPIEVEHHPGTSNRYDERIQKYYERSIRLYGCLAVVVPNSRLKRRIRPRPRMAVLHFGELTLRNLRSLVSTPDKNVSHRH
jgi:hypothetical protein